MNRKWNFIAVTAFCLTVFGSHAFAQPAGFSVQEDSLKALSELIWKQKDDKALEEFSEKFAVRFQQVLELPGSFSYPFDSLRHIGRLASEDGRFKIFTWNIQKSDGRFFYYGIIQTGGKNPGIFPLIDSKTRQGILKSSLSGPDDWYGALYYKIIPSKINKQDVYLLLGWDGIDNHSNSKLIEVLSFGTDGSPRFGMPVFHTPEGILPRVVFEYAEDVSMVLRYDYQTLLVPKGKGVKRKQMWMIVTDHLVPLDPGLEGQHRYYAPAGDTYDAFIFRKGKWLFAEGIEANNPADKNKSEGHKNLNYNLLPSK